MPREPDDPRTKVTLPFTYVQDCAQELWDLGIYVEET